MPIKTRRISAANVLLPLLKPVLAGLYRTYDLTTRFKTYDKKSSPCECITRGDGERIRVCGRHNRRIGTHGRTRGAGGGE